MAGGGEPDAAVTMTRLQATYPAKGPVRECEVQDKGEASRVTVDGIGVEIHRKQGDPKRGWCTGPDGAIHSYAVYGEGGQIQVWLDGRVFVFEAAFEEAGGGRRPGALPGDVSAPMPGRVMQVLAGNGQRVGAGEPLVILESMKMELIIDAPGNAVVKRVAVEEGDLVDRGTRLLELEAPDEGA